MFPTSSQMKFWTFLGTTELNQLRGEANKKYIQSADKSSEPFLTSVEERQVCLHYEYVLKEFCVKFQPPMPKYVMGTSMAFLKRFYLHNSVMDYHPKDLVWTCVYLACKVEEFNVSIMQFVANLSGDREAEADLILSQELLLMQMLHYHLTVHNPFRPLEGLLIDIKTRCPEVSEAEQLRRGADDFLDRSLNTDVGLIFSPSQIALAAVLSSATKLDINLDSYVANTLLASGGQEKLHKTIEHIKRIRFMVKNKENLDRNQVKAVLQKLEHCRNQENNPESEIYKQKMEEFYEDEDERRSKKNEEQAEVERQAHKELLGL